MAELLAVRFSLTLPNLAGGMSFYLNVTSRPPGQAGMPLAKFIQSAPILTSAAFKGIRLALSRDRGNVRPFCSTKTSPVVSKPLQRANGMNLKRERSKAR